MTNEQSIYEQKPLKANIRELYIKTWVFSYAIRDYWKIAEPDVAWRRSFISMSDALRAELDGDRAGVLDEMANAVIMMILSLGSQYPIRRVNGIPATDLDTLCNWVSDAWASYRTKRRNPDRWKTITVGIIQSIAEYPGMDLNARLTARLDRIMAKHGPEGGLAALTAPDINTPSAILMEQVIGMRDDLAQRGEAIAIIEEALANEAN